MIEQPIKSMKGIQVLIADGQDLVRRGLKELVLEAFPESVVLEASNGDEVRRRLAENSFNLMLLDIDMLGHRGFSVLREARRDHPDVPVIIVSARPMDQYAEHCLQAEAVAYISKAVVSEKLTQAMEAVLRCA